ncbi:hypothetical protein [Vulgatibacter sp.]|uniref:hypothetical protein n=1 Tax=Vulgatibacter sp. TaxID=1971226 RepID=UPI0035670B74
MIGKRMHTAGLVAATLLLCAAAGCGAADGDTTSENAGPIGGGGAGGQGGAGGAGGSGGSGGAGGAGGAGGSGGSQQQPVQGAPLVFRSTERLVLVDTADAQASLCGTFAQVSGTSRQLVVDLDACGAAIPAEAVGLVGSVTVDTTSTETIEVQVQASGAAVAGAGNVVGPLQTATHGFLTQVGSDRAFVVDVGGSDAAHVRVEMSAALVPEDAGGDYVHLLDQPLRWYAANPNDDGFRDVWPTTDSVLRYPVAGADEGATGMFGAVHLGPGVWRDERVGFHMGAAQPASAGNVLPRWSSVPVDGHFPWRYSSFFATGASAAQEIEMRASAATYDTGIEPWVDVVGYFSATPGLVYRPLDRPLAFAPDIHVNDEDVRFDTGFTDVEGVVGTLTFDLPSWPYDERNRWFFVMAGANAETFGGALGGGLEGPDWMTAGLNQNGRVTVRFTTRTEAGRFVMRHYAYVAGGSSEDPSYHEVTVQVRIDGVLTTAN